MWRHYGCVGGSKERNDYHISIRNTPYENSLLSQFVILIPTISTKIGSGRKIWSPEPWDKNKMIPTPPSPKNNNKNNELNNNLC